MSAAQASILDDLDAPLRRCIQNLEASCQSRQEALFEDYEDSKAKFLEQYPDADFELDSPSARSCKVGLTRVSRCR